MSFGGCLGPLPELAAAAGAVAGLLCGAIPAVVEAIRPASRPASGLTLAAGAVFVAVGAGPWAPTWIALWQRHGSLDTLAWWASVIVFGIAAALLRRGLPRALTPLVYAAAVVVGGWQGHHFARTAMSSSCTGDDPFYAGVGFALGTLVPWWLAMKWVTRGRQVRV